MSTHIDEFALSSLLTWWDSDLELDPAKCRAHFEIWGEDEQVIVTRIECNDGRNGVDNWVKCELPPMWKLALQQRLQKQIDDERIRERDAYMEANWESEDAA